MSSINKIKRDAYKKDYEDRLQTLMFKAFIKYPEAIIWDSFETDEELQQWIEDSERKEFYEATKILREGKEKGLHKIKTYEDDYTR